MCRWLAYSGTPIRLEELLLERESGEPPRVYRSTHPAWNVVVSEPLGDLPGAWNAVPESHVGIVQPGEDELCPFSPR